MSVESVPTATRAHDLSLFGPPKTGTRLLLVGLLCIMRFAHSHFWVLKRKYTTVKFLWLSFSTDVQRVPACTWFKFVTLQTAQNWNAPSLLVWHIWLLEVFCFQETQIVTFKQDLKNSTFEPLDDSIVGINITLKKKAKPTGPLVVFSVLISSAVTAQISKI